MLVLKIILIPQSRKAFLAYSPKITENKSALGSVFIHTFVERSIK